MVVLATVYPCLVPVDLPPLSPHLPEVMKIQLGIQDPTFFVVRNIDVRWRVRFFSSSFFGVGLLCLCKALVILRLEANHRS